MVKLKTFEPVIIKLLEKKVDSAFIEFILKNENTRFDEKYIKINVIGFLKQPDYSHHYNDFSVRKTFDFITDNIETFKKCENKFKIPKEIVAAIIWIESKNGNYLGSHHIPTVLLSTSLASEPQFIDMNKKNLYEILKDSNLSLSTIKNYEEKIVTRSIKKSERAFNELLALYEIYKNDNYDVTNIYGSWAGAFGISQFLPSSYLNWAIDGNNDNIVDLFCIEDAIFSVANYLKINGWSNDLNDKKKALFHYNNSNDYVNAVFILAEKVKNFESLLKPLDE